MKIIERIYNEIDVQGKNAADLARHLGVSTGQTTAWKQRQTDPPAKYIPQIAEFLNKSVCYVITGEDAISHQIEIKTEPTIIPYGGNGRIDSIIKMLLNSSIDDNDLHIIEAVLDKYKR